MLGLKLVNGWFYKYKKIAFLVAASQSKLLPDSYCKDYFVKRLYQPVAIVIASIETNCSFFVNFTEKCVLIVIPIIHNLRKSQTLFK